MDNPEKLVTLATQKTETNKTKNTIGVGHHYASAHIRHEPPYKQLEAKTHRT